MSRSAIRQHLQRCIPVALAAMIVSASGCSSVTFKRGAGPGQMANDEETCHASSSNDNRAFVTCMEARGWYVKIPDRVEQETAGESWMTKLRKSDTTNTPTDSLDPRLTSSSPPATEPTEISEEFDPLKPLQISSWWKLGGSASALDRAISDCAAELGEQHRPTAGATQVTAGMLACLRSGGWHGLGVKATGSAPN